MIGFKMMLMFGAAWWLTKIGDYFLGDPNPVFNAAISIMVALSYYADSREVSP